MIVYIVTSGSYSDYHIQRCFLEKEKAYFYADNSIDCRVEEYDTSDHETIEVITYAHIESKATKSELLVPKIRFVKTNTSDNPIEHLEYTYLRHRSWLANNEEYLITMVRLVRQGESQQEAEQRFTKVLCDMHKQINGLLAQGISFKDIERILRGK